MTRMMTGLTVAGLLLAVAPATAQDRWGFEVRAGADVPTQDIGDDGLDTGIGFEATVQYGLMPHLAAYAGWGWSNFQAEQSFAGADMDFEETGYVFGLRFQHPFRGEEGGMGYWLRAGGTVGHIEIEDQEGDLTLDSDHGLGWEAGAGLALPVGGRWTFTPGVRYRSLDRDIEQAAVVTPVELRYVAFEVGIARTF